MRVIKNKFKKKCSFCGVNVKESEGWAYNLNGWKTVCRMQGCQRKEQGLVEEINRIIASKGTPTRKILSNGEIIINPFDWESLPKIKTMPGARFNSYSKNWSVSLDACDRERVIKIAKDLKLDIPQGFDQVVESNETIMAENRAVSVGAYPYQIEGVKYLAARKKALLADDMGLGKTLQSLIALPEGAKAIFICPSSLKSNVEAEVLKWRPDLTTFVCKGRKGSGAFRIPQKNEVVILNYEIIPNEFTPTDRYGNQHAVPTHIVESLKDVILIADEVHVCKNPTSLKSKRCRVLSNIVGRVWAMTGTPILSKGIDLWGVLSSFNLERMVFGSWGNFTKLMNGEKVWVSSRNKAWVWGSPSPEVPSMLRKVMLRRLKKNVLTDLPPKTYQTVLCDISSKSLFNQTMKIFEGIKTLTASEPLPDFQKFSEMRAKLAKDRIPALMDLVDSFEESGEPVVVFSAYKAPIEALFDREGWAIITSDNTLEERREAVEMFQNGLLKGIGLTIRAGGVGLTLTHASKMIFVDQEWNPSLNAQAEDRICRIGQKASNLQYIKMVSNCALDVHVHKILELKKQLIQNAVENEITTPIVLTEKSVEELGHLSIAETDEELNARLQAEKDRKKRSSEALNKAKASARVSANRNRWTGLGGRGCLLPNPSPDQVRNIYDALNEMLNRCDGAMASDNRGFNKPDAGSMRTITVSGLLNNDVALQKYVWGTLRKYSRQLKTTYPNLFY